MSISGDTQAWVQVLGWSLLHFVWQGLIIGLLFALTRSLISRENTSLRYAAGLISLSALALCLPLTLWFLRPEGEVVVSSLGTFTVTAESAGAMDISTGSSGVFSEWLPALVLVWVIGVAVMLCRAVHQWRVLDRIATKLAYRQAEIEAILLRVADQFGAMHGTRVLVSRFIDTPTLIGWFKPVILLPAAVAVGFPRQQLELILAHELGHLHRHDHLVNLGQAVVETVLFYHPVVHWISREVRHDREICCDNLVLGLTDSEPREYARTLAALEDVRQLSPQLAVAASGGMLIDRVRRIIGAAAPHGSDRSSLPIAWGVVASCAIAVSAIIVLPRVFEEQPKQSFDQPRLPHASTGELSLALVPNDQTLQWEAVKTPVLTVADATENVAIEVNGNIELPSKPVAMMPSPSILEVAAPVPDRLQPDSLAQIAVTDLEMESTPVAMVAPPSAPLDTNSPVLIHKVAPDYPDNGRGGSYAKVGFLFSIDRAGRVRNVRSIEGDTQGTFAIAARNALRQWKFDPKSIAADGVRNYRQDFEFVSASRALSDENDSGCITPTGSHLCRPGRGVGLAFKAEERVASVSKSENLVDNAAQGDECVPQTGSRMCRPDSEGDIAMNDDKRAETSSHVIVLAGGSP